MSNEVFKNDVAITLDWADVSGANLYHVQVTLEPDFSAPLIVDDNALAVSTKSFNDTGADDGKRYWRWRSSANGGTTWSEWSEIGSYWLNTAGSADISLSSDEWVIFDPDTLTDLYRLPEFPTWRILDANMFRVKDRNRLGELLSEWYANKALIELEYTDRNFVSHEHMRAQKRFNLEIKTFFLAVKKSNGVDYVPHIWKVQFTEDPASSMLAVGRGDFFTGTYRYEEV